MGLYKRPDSPFWWMSLERPGLPAKQESTRIPIHGGTVEQTKDNHALAQQVYAARLGDLARARHHLPIDKPTIAFAKFRAWYAEQFTTHKARSAQPRERSMLKQLGRYFDPRDLQTITREDCLEWRSARALEVAPRTVNREQALLCHLLGQAVPKYLDANPAAKIPELKAQESPIRILSDDEEARLIAACTTEDRVLVLCGLDTLQRLSAVANLERRADHGTAMEFLNLKTQARLSVPISSRLRDAIDLWQARRTDDGAWLLPSFHAKTSARANGRPRQAESPESVANRADERFRALLAAANIPIGKNSGGISFHSLRHTGATRMLRRGVDPKTVMDIGGWKSIRMLEKYLHSDDAHHRWAVEMVAPRKPGVKGKRGPAGRRGPSRAVIERPDFLRGQQDRPVSEAKRRSAKRP
jgi:integrase